MNNGMKQGYGGLSKVTIQMHGFGLFTSATRFCTVHDELRDHLCFWQHLNVTVSLVDHHHLFPKRWGKMGVLLRAVGEMELAIA